MIEVNFSSLKGLCTRKWETPRFRWHAASLGCLPEGEELRFGGGEPLGFEQQVGQILIASSAA